MANESIRIRTTPGVDKNIRIKLEQDFDFLEILSLKISQEDLYQTFCANYGVVVGRVILNQGFGVPNAKVSIFIPITNEDKKNELIKDLYPFKTPYQKNNDGIRYNLLLSKTTCVLNTPVGSFPTKQDVLDNDIVLEVFDKYYKYTTKTNNSGDFMLFGVPTGQQQIHMDVDISDIGTASVRPYDLIADGFPENLFESKVEFKKSTNLDSLPQIKTGNKGIEVIPFWGDTEQCEVGITRADFDTGLNVTTTSLFFGSIFTDSGKMALNRGCNPKNDMGEADELRTGPGIIKMVRVKNIDANDWANNGTVTPTELEKFDIDGGDLIDDDGVFSYPLPMNIGHVITDEFGMLVPSPDPSIGIPTKAMYRFAMKFAEPPDRPKLRTATILFPSLGREFDGTKGVTGTPNSSINDANGTEDQRFTDDICEYNTDSSKCGGTVYNQSRIFMDFHTFEWKQIYTIAHFVKKYKKGGNRFSHIGLKNTDVSGKTNLFPYNNSIWKFDIIYYLLAAFVDFYALLLKVFITLIVFCFGFCFSLRVCVYFTVPVIKKNIGGCFNIFSLCFSICPFKWLGDLIGTIHLPAEDCGPPPDNDGWDIDLRNCNTAGGYCGQYKFIDFNGCPSGCGGPCTGTSAKAGVTPDPFPPSASNNACLQAVEDWRCCVKLNIAESRNVIRRTFNDAWVFGTAYLFQFKYKSKKKKNGGTVVERFCGPGSDQVRGDNYKKNRCCIDTENNDNCDRCLLRGPGDTRGHQYTGVYGYHLTNHNYATSIGKTGAVDLEDIIYCNALASTKIVSLGRTEMCEETLEQIELAAKASQAASEYAQKPQFYTGTFNEQGWDVGYWTQQLSESSYQDPRDVLLYLSHHYDCKLNTMFDKQQGCHEYEMRDYAYFFMKEVSKIYNDVVTTTDNLGSDTFNPLSDSNPIANSPAVDSQDPSSYVAVNGGFEVDRELANRFSPCGAGGNCVPYKTTYGNWSDVGYWGQQSSGNWTAPGYIELSTDNNAFDNVRNLTSRNNQNTKSNIPYYYFGINPGKTAITKLRKDFFFQ